MSTQIIECGWRCRRCGAARVWQLEVDLVTDDGLHSVEDTRRWGLATWAARVERDETAKIHAEECERAALVIIGTHIYTPPS